MIKGHCSQNTALRGALTQIYEAAIARVSGFDTVKGYLFRHPLQGQYHVVAIGKAACAMARGAEEAMDFTRSAGLVITKHGYLQGECRFRPDWLYMESDHPVPGESSLHAGQRLLDFITRAPPSARFLFLISGGASSLVEVLPKGFGLSDLQQLNNTLLCGGFDITLINEIRKCVSRIKGGRLLEFIGNRKAIGLLISDVPGDDLSIIGSGLLVPTRQVFPAKRRIPENLRRLLAMCNSEENSVRPSLQTPMLKIIACLQDAKQAAAKKALELGYKVYEHAEFLEGDVLQAATRLAFSLRRSGPGVHIWGGETIVDLPSNPGRGGRNQHLALALALELEGVSGVVVLASATDGSDGPTLDAGGLIDGLTIDRGKKAGLDARQCLQAADAGRYLHTSGDLLSTGPTGTNVMDLVIGVKP